MSLFGVYTSACTINVMSLFYCYFWTVYSMKCRCFLIFRHCTTNEMPSFFFILVLFKQWNVFCFIFRYYTTNAMSMFLCFNTAQPMKCVVFFFLNSMVHNQWKAVVFFLYISVLYIYRNYSTSSSYRFWKCF